MAETEVRDGYKMTELGEIPVEWEVKKIEDISEVKTGGTPSKSINEYWANGYIRWMTSGEVNNKKIYDVKERITELGYQSSNTTLLPKNTVMMALNGQGKTRGTVAILEVETTCNQSLAGIIGSDAINGYYLYYFLDDNYEELRALTGEGRSGLNLNIIREILIALPPFPEQKKIAEILSTVDEQIENTEQLIKKTKELKKGLMQQLLTKGIGHTEFKETELGEIPVGWEVYSLEDISERVTYGFTNPMPTTIEGPYMITAKDVIHGKINYNTARRTDSKLFNDALTDKSKPRLNDILVTKDGTLGRLAIVDKEDICINQSVASIRLKSGVEVMYIYYLLSSQRVQDLIMFDAGGSTIKHIYISKLAKLKLPLSTNSYEQQKIASILSSVDEQIESYEAEKEKYVELKKGLMQQLLTGKMRVKI